ncbi:PREDICTED: mucin-like protein [Amphimedon queenslandica]|uniref:VWFD domain-containing protein n=1 Tax=Amphimedon queenslandica TaxID=400682 RepID=A0AAN0IXG0_AMPQE|nr:PREDICTED: mucin-like protein [Amphimedon queenslandica]|eukprot:XP_019849136.1 PREDICTED: mucin-like protein [Amphimedon queenslandica]
MLLIEWSAARPYPQGVFSDPFFDLHNTFQAVLTTDGTETHVIYIYKCGDIMWDTYHSTSVVGYNIRGFFFENSLGSGTPGGLLRFGCGDNADFTNILYSFSSDNNPAEAACLEAYRNDQDLREIGTFEASFAHTCPCSINQAWFDRRFRFLQFHRAERVACYINRFPSTYQSMCCYDFNFFRNSFRALITQGPFSSHVFRFHPQFSRSNYLTFDERFHSLCCIVSQNCELFRERRPIKTCTGYRPPIRSWFWGDPHITTLDEGSYTFNGLGEYVLLRTNSEDFEVQARTKLAAPNTTATVFSAIAVSDSNRSSTVEVRIDEMDPNEFVVLYNGSDMSANLTSVNDTLEFTTVTVTRETTELISIALSSGVGVNVTLRLAILSVTLNVPQSYMGNTTGLLGNFDQDNTNDFTSRNGTMISSNSTDANIFMFGQTWQLLSNEESLFTYLNGQI